MKQKKYITHAQYNKIIKQYNALLKQGVKPIIKRNTLKIGLGVVCLIVAIIPNGLGFALFPLSFYLLGINKKDIDNLKRLLKNKCRGCRG